MARNRKTYIVNVKAADGTVHSFTLRDYCAKIGLPYGTVLARIFRTRPEITEGVIYFEEKDPIIADAWERGNPRKKTPPKRQRKNQLTAPKHARRRPGDYRNKLK